MQPGTAPQANGFLHPRTGDKTVLWPTTNLVHDGLVSAKRQCRFRDQGFDRFFRRKQRIATFQIWRNFPSVEIEVVRSGQDKVLVDPGEAAALHGAVVVISGAVEGSQAAGLPYVVEGGTVPSGQDQKASAGAIEACEHGRLATAVPQQRLLGLTDVPQSGAQVGVLTGGQQQALVHGVVLDGEKGLAGGAGRQDESGVLIGGRGGKSHVEDLGSAVRTGGGEDVAGSRVAAEAVDSVLVNEQVQGLKGLHVVDHDAPVVAAGKKPRLVAVAVQTENVGLVKAFHDKGGTIVDTAAASCSATAAGNHGVRPPHENAAVIAAGEEETPTGTEPQRVDAPSMPDKPFTPDFLLGLVERIQNGLRKTGPPRFPSSFFSPSNQFHGLETFASSVVRQVHRRFDSKQTFRKRPLSFTLTWPLSFVGLCSLTGALP